LPSPRACKLDPRRVGLAAPERFLAHLAKRDIAQLTTVVKTRLRRMQYQPGLIEGFLAGTRPSASRPSVTPGRVTGAGGVGLALRKTMTEGWVAGPGPVGS
jgi:putative transposase